MASQDHNELTWQLLINIAFSFSPKIMILHEYTPDIFKAKEEGLHARIFSSVCHNIQGKKVLCPLIII